MIRLAAIETENLEAHVSICEQRYLNLEARLDTLENKIERIENLLSDINQKIQDLNVTHDTQINQGLVYVVGILLAVCGFLVNRLFF